MSIQQRFLICPLYRQYLRDCKSLLKTVAIQCLRRFGIYVYFVQVPEPEMELNTEMYAFFLYPSLSASGVMRRHPLISEAGGVPGLRS